MSQAGHLHSWTLTHLNLKILCQTAYILSFILTIVKNNLKKKLIILTNITCKFFSPYSLFYNKTSLNQQDRELIEDINFPEYCLQKKGGGKHSLGMPLYRHGCSSERRWNLQRQILCSKLR